MCSAERRRWTRVRQRITVEYEVEGQRLTASLEDIGEGGMFIDASHPLAEGTEIRFSLALPDGESLPVCGTGRVTWTEELMGAGIEFLRVADSDRDRIRAFVESEGQDEDASLELADDLET